ncbi:DsbA family protein [Paenibacillus segetis]|uniref:Disulfide bond formation protein D n=1 Tax=Paenibacillus segetis TaxID=1325360 RepID=A0ABQ1YLF3_9BACL|nr:DsbA family protein [Paenibacillus segetis]GGH29184.1 putative disulfide bond formation protein D [Paenibacillus segetis]
MPPKKSSNVLAQRKAEAIKIKQKQKMRRIIWFGTLGVVLILVIVGILLQPKSASKEGIFDYANLPVLGNVDAPVKIVEFGDFKCPSCKAFNDTIKKQLQSDYIDQGKVAFYFMNLAFIGPDSYTAALAVQSVYHQDKELFWTYLDALYNNQGDENTVWATTDFLVNLAKQENLPIDYELLRKDIEDKTYKNEVDAHIAKADELRLGGTPTIFINGVEYVNQNYADYNAMKQAIDQAIQDQSK